MAISNHASSQFRRRKLNGTIVHVISHCIDEEDVVGRVAQDGIFCLVRSASKRVKSLCLCIGQFGLGPKEKDEEFLGSDVIRVVGPSDSKAQARAKEEIEEAFLELIQVRPLTVRLVKLLTMIETRFFATCTYYTLANGNQ